MHSAVPQPTSLRRKHLLTSTIQIHQAAARQAGALLDLAERCAHDARQLGDGGLAAEFDRVSRQLAGYVR